VFVRNGTNWAQQAKLVANNPAGAPRQGTSVALSADGNAAIVGGFADSGAAGAAWVFTRSGGVWTQQAKLVGSNASITAAQGASVALSADGNTAIIGGPCDAPSQLICSTAVGAAWVFTRSGGVWSEQAKLVGTGAVGAAQQGTSVALSPSGNFALVGGPLDNGNAGATWVFTRGSGTWIQQGSKLVSALTVGNAAQGSSVALSCNTAAIGGPSDNSNAGVAWTFVPPRTNTHDFNGDCLSDILWRDGSGNVAMWFMNGTAVQSSAIVGNVPLVWTIQATNAE
jgi:hypothetical protein